MLFMHYEMIKGPSINICMCDLLSHMDKIIMNFLITRRAAAAELRRLAELVWTLVWRSGVVEEGGVRRRRVG